MSDRGIWHPHVDPHDFHKKSCKKDPASGSGSDPARWVHYQIAGTLDPSGGPPSGEH